MLKAVEAVIRKYGMLQKGDRVLVGLSGGADSVCLCHILWRLQEPLGISVRALHVNHGIRGEEALRDENFCKAFCEKFDIPLEVYHCSVPTECEKTKEGTEECARRMRYAAFAKYATEKEKIATAHTANDNAETVLLHMARGTGLKGLCGIPPIRGKIIRPLIEAGRAETEAYCEREQLSFVTDSTNLSKAYARNRVRMDALPALETVNPAALQAMTRMTALLTEEENLLCELTQKALRQAETAEGLSVEILKSYPKGLSLRVIQQKLKNTWAGEFTHAHAEAVFGLLQSGREVQIADAHIVSKQNGSLIFSQPPQSLSPWSVSISLDTLQEKTIETPAYRVRMQKIFRKDLQNFHKELFPNAVDCAKIGTNLELRSRQSGDRFSHPKRKVTKTLKKWLNEEKIPASERNACAVLSSGDDVLWTANFGTSAPFLPNEKTEQILFLSILNGGNTNE